jgi:hypothetical protein
VRTIQEDVLILPKLFRRLISFMDGYADFGQLEAFMKKQRDNLVLWDGTKKKSLADLMKFSGRRMQMKTPVDDILFSPK